MTFENDDEDRATHPDHAALVKEVKARKRFRVASCILITWDNLQNSVEPFFMEVADDGTASFNDSLASTRIVESLNRKYPNYDPHEILLKILTTTSSDTSWIINDEWYFELIADLLFTPPRSSARTDPLDNIASYIRQIQGLNIKEKIDCIIDAYIFYNKINIEIIKNRISHEYNKIKKLMDWLTTDPDQEPTKIHHVENAIQNITTIPNFIGVKKENRVKIMIITNRNQAGFCNSVLTSARKTWNQQVRRESGNSKQLGLSVKKETAEMLKAIAKKNSLSETQTLEILIKSEFKTEVHMKEFSKILAAIEKL